MNRGEILDAVKLTITQDRQDTHGNPEDTFPGIADYWNVYLAEKLNGRKISGQDVAVMMALFKVARYSVNPHHADNLHDGIGYLAIAAERW